MFEASLGSESQREGTKEGDSEGLGQTGCREADLGPG